MNSNNRKKSLVDKIKIELNKIKMFITKGIMLIVFFLSFLIKYKNGTELSIISSKFTVTDITGPALD